MVLRGERLPESRLNLPALKNALDLALCPTENGKNLLSPGASELNK